jgi:hypothetical protein
MELVGMFNMDMRTFLSPSHHGHQY